LPARRAVVDQEGVLERRAGAFHLGLGALEHAAPALLDEAGGRGPGAGRVVRPGIERADPVLAHHVEREPLDRVMVEHEARRHHEVVIRQRLAALGRDGLHLGVDGGDPLGDQRHAGWQPIGGLADDVAGGLEPGGDQRQARLVEVLGARVDQGDLRALQPAHQPVGKGGAGGARADDHDPRVGRNGLRPCLGRRHRGGGAPGCGQRQKGAAAGLNVGCHARGSPSSPVRACLL